MKAPTLVEQQARYDEVDDLCTLASGLAEGEADGRRAVKAVLAMLHARRDALDALCDEMEATELAEARFDLPGRLEVFEVSHG